MQTTECGNLLYFGFNQDHGCFSVGTETGFAIWNCNPLKLRFKRDFDGGIRIVEMLYRCNLLALVGGGKKPKFPRNKLIIWDDYRNEVLAEIEYNSIINSVKLRHDKIVVAVDEKVFVYNFSDLNIIDQIPTVKNPKGLLAIAPEGETTVLACPHVKTGYVKIKIYSPTNSQTVVNIKCHESELSQIALNSDGSKLATTSVQGTLIRLWDTKTKEKLTEIRRGRFQASINCLSFSKSSNKLCLSSDKGTVHVFSLTDSPQPKPPVQPEPANTGWGSSWFGGYSNYLSVENLGKGIIWNWAHAQFKLNCSQSLVAFGTAPAVIEDDLFTEHSYREDVPAVEVFEYDYSIKDDEDDNYVVVLLSNGSLKRFEFDKENGGGGKEVECSLFLSPTEDDI